MGLGLQGLGFTVQGLRFQGFGFRVQGVREPIPAGACCSRHLIASTHVSLFGTILQTSDTKQSNGPCFYGPSAQTAV